MTMLTPTTGFSVLDYVLHNFNLLYTVFDTLGSLMFQIWCYALKDVAFWKGQQFQAKSCFRVIAQKVFTFSMDNS